MTQRFPYLNHLAFIASLPFMIYLLMLTPGMLFAVLGNILSYTPSTIPDFLNQYYELSSDLWFYSWKSLYILSSSLTIYTCLVLPASMLVPWALLRLIKTHGRQVFTNKSFYYFTLAFIIVLPFALVLIRSVVSPYQPATQAKPGVVLYHADKPQGLEKVEKNMKFFMEDYRYDYVLKGWADDQTFVFEKYEDETLIATLQYNVETQQTTPYSGDTENLSYTVCTVYTCVGPYIAYDYYEREQHNPEDPNRSFYNAGTGDRLGYAMLSPDGHWAAFLSESFSAQADVLVVKIK